MLTLSWQRVARVLAVSACICAAANTRAQPQPTPVRIANPAARKCVDEGYRLEPVRAVDGLTVSYDCIDQGSGQRCDTWDFFRDDCRLPTRGSRSESDRLE